MSVRHERVRPFTLLAALLAVATQASAAVLQLRGSPQPLNVERAVVEPGGVRITKPGGVTEVIAWDMVRSMQGADNGTIGAKEAEQLLTVAADLWRARSRAQRGDLAAARPLFERHFERFRGTTSETALIVAEGTLRARLASDEWITAIVPALEVARLRKGGVTTDRFVQLPTVIDESTLLCPQLAPVWTVSDETRALAQTIQTSVFSDPAVSQLAGLYANLLRGEVPSAPARKDESSGIALLHAIATLRSGTPAVREQAVKELLALVKSGPPWVRAWANYAIGRTAVESSGSDPAAARAAQIDGVLALIRVAAQPGVPRRIVVASLDLAISTLQALGDAEGAAALERERATLTGKSIRAATRKPDSSSTGDPPSAADGAGETRQPM